MFQGTLPRICGPSYEDGMSHSPQSWVPLLQTRSFPPSHLTAIGVPVVVTPQTDPLSMHPWVPSLQVAVFPPGHLTSAEMNKRMNEYARENMGLYFFVIYL